MTALDIINKLNKDVWAHSDKMFGDVFDNMFSNMSMNSAIKSFPFYNVVKYGKGEYGIELGLAGFNKKNVKVQYKDGVPIIWEAISIFLRRALTIFSSIVFSAIKSM
jgi:molecular chaperone IbpA